MIYNGEKKKQYDEGLLLRRIGGEIIWLVIRNNVDSYSMPIVIFKLILIFIIIIIIFIGLNKNDYHSNGMGGLRLLRNT